MSIATPSRTERLAAAMGPVQQMVESRAVARRGLGGGADLRVGRPPAQTEPRRGAVLERPRAPTAKT